MSEVRITALAAGAFGVEIDEGGRTTGHRVHVPPSFLGETRLDRFDEETVVRESVRFLLEREPAASILADFTLADIPRYFPDYHDELRARLGRLEAGR